jgi:hypothetical protein
MLGRLTFAALILAASASGALSAQATLGQVSVTLPPPAGFCELNASNSRDSRMLSILSGLAEKSGNKLLAMSADCGQLADAHAGRRQVLDDFAQYQTRSAIVDRPPSESVAQTCVTLRTRGSTFAAALWPDMKARIESAVEKVRINETSFIGVLAEDSHACYAAWVEKGRTEAGTDKTQVTVGAVTIIRSRSIYVYRSAVYQNPDTIDAALAKFKADVAALVAANP